MDSKFLEPELIKKYLDNQSPEHLFKILHKEKQENTNNFKNQFTNKKIEDIIENPQNTEKQTVQNLKFNVHKKKIKKSQSYNQEVSEEKQLQQMSTTQEVQKIESSKDTINQITSLQNLNKTQQNTQFQTQNQYQQAQAANSQDNNDKQLNQQTPTINNKFMCFPQQLTQQPQLIQQLSQQPSNNPQSYFQNNLQGQQQNYPPQFNQQQQNMNIQKILYTNMLYLNRMKNESQNQCQQLNQNITQFPQFQQQQQQYMNNFPYSLQQQQPQFSFNNNNLMPSQNPQLKCSYQQQQYNQNLQNINYNNPYNGQQINQDSSYQLQIPPKMVHHNFHYIKYDYCMDHQQIETQVENQQNQIFHESQEELNNIDLLTDENESSQYREKQSIDAEDQNQLYSLVEVRNKEDEVQTARLNKKLQFDATAVDNYYNNDDDFAHSKIHEMEQEIQFQ